MKTHSNHFRLESIHYDNTSTKVLIKGETIKEHLSYRSEMFVNFSDLNIFLNELVRTNPTIELETITQSEEYGDYSATTITATSLKNKTLNMSDIHLNQTYMKIRA